jgi:transcriptional regulator with GAF, ATPase, and Fis domain
MSEREPIGGKVKATRDASKPVDCAESLTVSELVRDIGGATDVEDAANRTIKHALHLTGARWADVLEPRGQDALHVLGTTDCELALEMLRMAELGRQRPELLAHRPAADQIVIDDLATDQRWPELAALVREHVPVRSAVLQFIVVEGRYAALMPVYDDRLSYFTAMHQHALQTLAEIAGFALAGLAAARQVEQLTSALESNRTISRAVGNVMADHNLPESEAFGHLVQESQHSNRKLRDIARDVTAEATLRCCHDGQRSR